MMMAMRQGLRTQTACAIFIFVSGIVFTAEGALQLRHTETHNEGIYLVIFGTLLMTLGSLSCVASICIQEEWMPALFVEQPLVPLAVQEQGQGQGQEQDQNLGGAPAV